jgi:K+-sensing histidine kinase KdpD
MWIAADLSSSQDEKTLLAIAQRMTTSAPHAAARAERILAAAHSNDTPEPQTLHIKHAICHAAELAGIGVTINGEAEVFIRSDLLDRAPYASSRPGGLGLGLYQARNSLREAGGDLTAKAHDQKITFFITLPRPKKFPM